MTPQEKAYRRKLVRDFENAVMDLAFVGAAELNDRENIKATYKRKKDLLLKNILKD
ncbi:hypothetical protein D3C76_28300 [compost metagenome]